MGMDPVEVVMEFIRRINSGEPDSLCELMTEDHIFQDPLGKRFVGREIMREGWRAYFKIVSGYRIRPADFIQNDLMVGVFGAASGTCVKSGQSPANTFWQVPAAWKARVRNGQIAEWHVYADNQPLRKLMGDPAP